MRLTEAPLVSTGYDEPAGEGRPAASVESPEDRARRTVTDLFPPNAPGLPPLDWQYDEGTATAQVDPGLVVDAARNVLLAYASHLGAAFQQEQVGGRLLLRTARAFDGVKVAVWADVTPDPEPDPEPAPAPDQPHISLPPSRLEMDAYLAATGQEHPHANPDEGAKAADPDGPMRDRAEPHPTADTPADATSSNGENEQGRGTAA